MSWVVNTSLTWFQRLCLNIIKCGPVPQHIALIMDGNRRFAKKIHKETRDGHTRGFDKLAETLQWCLELNIREVTVYAFSIENFKRNSQEVTTLMELAREKFKRIMDEREQLMTEGVCIRVIGNISLLPSDIRKLIAECVLMTKDNNRVFLNIAFAYTSREEITNAIQIVTDGVCSGDLDTDDIDEQLLSSCLYTNRSQPPDILVRTSGETRLSDFLLWQIEDTIMYFTDVLWPEFNIWNLLAIVFQYQMSLHKLQKTTVKRDNFKSPNGRIVKFLENLEIRRIAALESYRYL